MVALGDQPAITPELLDRMIHAFREAATQQAAAPAVSRELVRAAAIVEVQDAQELQQVLRKLQEAGYAPLAAVPPDLLAAAGLPTPATLPAEGTGSRTGLARAAGDANEGPGLGRGYVSVYDPRYAALARPARRQERPAVASQRTAGGEGP
jgi:hypothetical protein